MVLLRALLMAGFVVFSVTNALADELHLTDETIINCKVIKITPYLVEYDLNGERPYHTVDREKVNKIVYDNGQVRDLSLPDGTLGNQEPSNLYLELEAGWNSYVGLGPRLDYLFLDPFSINGGAGIGTWGIRLSAAARYYLKYPFGVALSFGYTYNVGLNEFNLKQNVIDPITNIVTEEAVEYEFKPVHVLNVSVLYGWEMFARSKVYVELGYAFALTEDKFKVKDDAELTAEAREAIDVRAPGGIIISIGVALTM